MKVELQLINNPVPKKDPFKNRMGLSYEKEKVAKLIAQQY